jgi:hypothetical protein
MTIPAEHGGEGERHQQLRGADLHHPCKPDDHGQEDGHRGRVIDERRDRADSHHDDQERHPLAATPDRQQEPTDEVQCPAPEERGAQHEHRSDGHGRRIAEPRQCLLRGHHARNQKRHHDKHRDQIGGKPIEGEQNDRANQHHQDEDHVEGHLVLRGRSWRISLSSAGLAQATRQPAESAGACRRSRASELVRGHEVAGAAPALDVEARIVEEQAVLLMQAFITSVSVERFDVRVLRS